MTFPAGAESAYKNLRLVGPHAGMTGEIRGFGRFAAAALLAMPPGSPSDPAADTLQPAPAGRSLIRL